VNFWCKSCLQFEKWGFSLSLSPSLPLSLSLSLTHTHTHTHTHTLPPPPIYIWIHGLSVTGILFLMLKMIQIWPVGASSVQFLGTLVTCSVITSLFGEQQDMPGLTYPDTYLRFNHDFFKLQSIWKMEIFSKC
jgi:hypothetical protein